MNNPQDEYRRFLDTKDHTVVVKNQMTVIGPEELVLWYSRTAVWHSFEGSYLVLKLNYKASGVFY